MTEYCFLSHKIEKIMPDYGKEDISLKNVPLKSIQKGDNCNVFSTTIHSHLGTHIDCPRHFFEKGEAISEYPAEFWIFEHPFLLQVKLKENEIIKKEVFFSLPQETDIVLIKSGFQRFRGQKKYNFNNPGVSPEAVFWLRENRSKLRAVGVDFTSVSPYQNREIGRDSHRAFLNPVGKNSPILIIEDMNLAGANNKLSVVWVVPLRVEFWDSAPCTVIGELKK